MGPKDLKTAEDYFSVMQELNNEEQYLQEQEEDTFYERKNQFAEAFLQGVTDGSIDADSFAIVYYGNDIQESLRKAKFLDKIYVYKNGERFTILPTIIEEQNPKLYESLVSKENGFNKTVFCATSEPYQRNFGYGVKAGEDLRFSDYDTAPVRYYSAYYNLPVKQTTEILDNLPFFENYSAPDMDWGCIVSCVFDYVSLGVPYEQAYALVNDLSVYHEKCEDCTLVKFQHNFIDSEIYLGLKSGVDISVYAKPGLNWKQMQQIRKGLEYGLSIEQISIFAKPEVNDTVMKIMRIGQEKQLDVFDYLNSGFDNDQLYAIGDALESGLSKEQISVLAKPEYDKYQMHAIQRGFECGLLEEQISVFARPEFNAGQMEEILTSLRWGEPKEQVSLFAKSEFDKDQMFQIRLGFMDKLSVEQIHIYAKSEFDKDQMWQIREGLKNGIDASVYADPELDDEQMCKIRKSLEAELPKPQSVNAKLDTLDKQPKDKSTNAKSKDTVDKDNR